MAVKLTFYYTNGSVPSQACLILINILELDIEIINLDLECDEFNENNNPIHKTPVLVDEELVLTESRAIMSYLIDSFISGHSIYPKELKQRAMIDQRLFYDAAVVFPSLLALTVTILQFLIRNFTQISIK